MLSSTLIIACIQGFGVLRKDMHEKKHCRVTRPNPGLVFDHALVKRKLKRKTISPKAQ